MRSITRYNLVHKGDNGRCSDEVLGEQVSIWYGAILRGDLNAIRINSYSNVQDKTVIHAARCGPGIPFLFMGCSGFMIFYCGKGWLLLHAMPYHRLLESGQEQSRGSEHLEGVR